MPQPGSATTTLTIPNKTDSTAAIPAGKCYAAYPEKIDIKQQVLNRAQLPPVGIILAFSFIIVRILMQVKKETSNHTPRRRKQIFSSPDNSQAFKYTGDQLVFTTAEYHDILSKHSPYFRTITESDKEKFIGRARKFISQKIFYIHSSNSFKEMPVLVTASAIQLSFGLDKYLYPHFKYIHIYPEEFLRTHPELCFLQGNVSGNSIRLSWKHFLKGLQNNTDGQDVGLHEMAHALYYQTFVTETHVDKDFRNFFDDFNDDGNKVYLAEQAMEAGLYSKYAMQNFQEFWAESVEIFFEKPILLREKYPDLFEAMKNILNQDLS